MLFHISPSECLPVRVFSYFSHDRLFATPWAAGISPTQGSKPSLFRQAVSLPPRHLGSLNPSQAMSFISVVLASQHKDWHRDGNRESFAFSLRWLRFVLSLDHSGAYFVTWPLLCILLLLLLLLLCILLHKLTPLSMLPGTAGWGD